MKLALYLLLAGIVVLFLVYAVSPYVREKVHGFRGILLNWAVVGLMFAEQALNLVGGIVSPNAEPVLSGGQVAAVVVLAFVNTMKLLVTDALPKLRSELQKLQPPQQ